MPAAHKFFFCFFSPFSPVGLLTDDLKYSSNVYVTISGVWKLTVIANKPETIQSDVVTKTWLSLILCYTVHELSILHAWNCDAMTRNVVKITQYPPPP